MRPYLFLAVLVAILFFPFLFQGRVFVPEDIIHYIYPWKAVSSLPVNNLELLDVATLFYPEDTFLNRSLKGGALPLWNPNRFAGHPWVASGQSALFYWPRNLAHFLLSPGAARSLTIMLHLLGMGWGMLFWLRSRGLSRAAAALGAVSWIGNAWSMSILEYEHAVDIGAYLAPCLYCVDRGLRDQGARWWCALSLLAGISLTAGHLQLCLVQGSLIAAYAAFQVWQSGRWRAVLPLVASAVAALIVASATLVPFVQLLGASQRATFSWEQLQAQASSLPALLVTLVCPDALGNPTFGLLFNRTPGNLVFNEFACYFGAVPLIFALSALFCRPRRETIFWGAAAGFCLLVAAATPFYAPIVWALPFLAKLIPGRVLHAFVFCAAVLAALGADAFLQGSPQFVSRAREVSLAVALGWLALWGVMAWLLLFQSAVWLSWLKPYWSALYIKLPPMDAPEARPAALLSLARSVYLANPQMYMPFLAALSVFVPGWGRRSAAGAVLCCLTAADLLHFGIRYNTTRPASELFATTPSLRFLLQQPGLFRVEKRDCAFYDTLEPFGLQLVSGYDSVIPKRYLDTMRASQPGGNVLMRTVSLRNLEHPLLDAFNVKFALLPPYENLESDHWKLVFSEDLKIYQNQRVCERVYVCPQARVCADFAGVQEYLARGSFHPRQEAVVELAPPGPMEASAANSVATVLDYGPDRVVVRADMRGAGILVLADSWYPGWECTANGRPVELFPVDGDLRGVYLPAGPAEVVYRFRPPAVRLTLWLSSALVALLLGWMLVDIRKGALRAPLLAEPKPASSAGEPES